MEWSVELVLRPGSTVLEQHVRLSNRNDIRQRFYWWSNAGVRIWDDSHIQYPMRYAAEHGFAAIEKWPIDAQGKDLSIIKNQTDGPVSMFVHGSREDFMGIWNPHSNSGTAHFARYDELPAKKIWSWGVDADGLDWRNALSDDNSAYAEVQGGLFRNQETYAFLQPRQHISFTEYWMPVRDLGGISRANLAAVAYLDRKNDSLVSFVERKSKISRCHAPHPRRYQGAAERKTKSLTRQDLDEVRTASRQHPQIYVRTTDPKTAQSCSRKQKVNTPGPTTPTSSSAHNPTTSFRPRTPEPKMTGCKPATTGN